MPASAESARGYPQDQNDIITTAKLAVNTTTEVNAARSRRKSVIFASLFRYVSFMFY
jgi:hypothetical protein